MVGRVQSFYPSTQRGVLLAADGRRLIFNASLAPDLGTGQYDLRGGDLVEFELAAGGIPSIYHVLSHLETEN